MPSSLSRRQFVRNSALLGIGLATGACSGDSGTSDSGSTGGRRTVKMKVMSETVHLKWWEDLAQLSNDSNSYDLELSFTPFSENTSFVSALSGNDAPDITNMVPGRRYLPPVAEAGLLADLAPYSQEFGWEDRFEPGLWADFPYEDTLPTVGVSALPHPFIWYDKAVFSELGLEVPANRQVTGEQMQAFISAASDSGKQPVTLGNKDLWAGGQTVSLICQRHLGRETLDHLRDNWRIEAGVRWTDPEPIEALALAQQAVRDGWFARGLNAMGDAEAMNLFVTGEAAMYQTGFWAVQVIPPVAPEMEFDFFQFPSINPDIPLSIINFCGAGVAISSKTSHREEAAALIDLALSDEGQRLLLEKYDGYPATSGLASAGGITFNQPAMKDIVTVVGEVESNPFQLENDAPPEIGQQTLQDLQGLLGLDMSPEDWAERTQRGIDDLRGA